MQLYAFIKFKHLRVVVTNEHFKRPATFRIEKMKERKILKVFRFTITKYYTNMRINVIITNMKSLHRMKPFEITCCP